MDSSPNSSLTKSLLNISNGTSKRCFGCQWKVKAPHEPKVIDEASQRNRPCSISMISGIERWPFAPAHLLHGNGDTDDVVGSDRRGRPDVLQPLVDPPAPCTHARGALLSNLRVHAPFTVVVRPWYRFAISTSRRDAGERISFGHGFVASIRTTRVIWLAELLHRVHDAGDRLLTRRRADYGSNNQHSTDNYYVIYTYNRTRRISKPCRVPVSVKVGVQPTASPIGSLSTYLPVAGS